ncbi:hypothetical protein [Kribbella sp. NPDC003557]|uniref:hypothetical protein n=1 Tax=Kribbella sp. NPDC003557 TaxID=3154449 RepID=UPI0033B3DBC7
MAQSRGRLIDELTDDVTRTALRSAGLSPEDRVLAGERVRRAIAAEAMGAHDDVVAAAHGDDGSAEAEAFSGYVHGSPQDRPRIAADSPARKLAVELLAAADRTRSMDPERAERAQEYIAHAITTAAEAAARKTPNGPSQAPAGTAAGTAAGAAAGAGPVAAPVAVVKTGLAATKATAPPERRGPSIG